MPGEIWAILWGWVFSELLSTGLILVVGDWPYVEVTMNGFAKVEKLSFYIITCIFKVSETNSLNRDSNWMSICKEHIIWASYPNSQSCDRAKLSDQKPILRYYLKKYDLGILTHPEEILADPWEWPRNHVTFNWPIKSILFLRFALHRTWTRSRFSFRTVLLSTAIQLNKYISERYIDMDD